MEPSAAPPGLIDRPPIPAQAATHAATRAATLAARYSRVAIVLHWMIAALVLSTMPLGWFSTSSQGAPAKPAANLTNPTDGAVVQSSPKLLTPLNPNGTYFGFLVEGGAGKWLETQGGD